MNVTCMHVCIQVTWLHLCFRKKLKWMQPTYTNVNSLIQVTVNFHTRKMAADTNTLSKFSKSGNAMTKDVLLGIQKLVNMVNIANIRKRCMYKHETDKSEFKHYINELPKSEKRFENIANQLKESKELVSKFKLELMEFEKLNKEKPFLIDDM